MSRPFYENQNDRSNETAVIQKVCDVLNCEWVKLKPSYGLDFGFCKDGKLIGLAEVKCRKYTFEKIDSLGGYMLSLHKWTAAKNLVNTTDLPFSLIVKDSNDQIRAAIFESMLMHYNIMITGRKDRNDWQDIEPCVMIPISSFTVKIK